MFRSIGLELIYELEPINFVDPIIPVLTIGSFFWLALCLLGMFFSFSNTPLLSGSTSLRLIWYFSCFSPEINRFSMKSNLTFLDLCFTTTIAFQSLPSGGDVGPRRAKALLVWLSLFPWLPKQHLIQLRSLPGFHRETSRDGFPPFSFGDFSSLSSEFWSVVKEKIGGFETILTSASLGSLKLGIKSLSLFFKNTS